jgi:UDP-glucose 4-epimerase
MIIIVGKNGNLSRQLQKYVAKDEDVFLISSIDSVNDLNKIAFPDSVSVVFNNFQSSTKLYEYNDTDSYLQRSLMCTSIVINYLIRHKVRVKKVLYTSSSSVYGNNIFCRESDKLSAHNLHSALKIANEKLVESVCGLYQIDFTICRVFNMYGGDDKFSVISKIIDAANSGETLKLYNNGNAIRDFIYIQDVVNLYEMILNKKTPPILNIGTADGVSMKSIIDYLNTLNISVQYVSVEKKELKTSTANIELLKSTFPEISFKKVGSYFEEILLGES